ncbi:uncharacterized protein LOC122851772 [Aphidius gifuensis]|uniref:uncharacterized protein LOC122851772 n=1 Tax=Aphidius gifuensis TaxID=684658 RepID=UPI001CDCA0FD|nr:uncharacterized protein LOC122851772 [Aphidius gifuensis]
MMSALSLIPFVIGLVGYDSCLKSTPDLWKYGPEYNFKVECNASLTNTAYNEISITNVTLDLICRPFYSTSVVSSGSDALQCKISNAQMNNYNFDIKNIKKHDNHSLPFEINNQTFEIIYTNNGIKNINIQLPVSPWRMNIYRTIASYLNYGYNDFVKNVETTYNITKLENSTLGECQANMSVTKYPNYEFTGVKMNSPCDKLKLETIAYKDKYPVVEFHKNRILNNCTKKTPYFFGGDDDTINKPSRYFTNNTNSYVVYVTAPLSFESQTINNGILTLFNKSAPVYESTSIRLVEIKPAKSEFKRIESPGITNIHSHSEIIIPAGV